MDTLIIAGTEDTPSILLNIETGEFSFNGRSLPEDVTSFYQPVIDWLAQFSEQPKTGARFNFKLEYFNTASSKILLDILMQLEEINDAASAGFVIAWHFQESDPDMKEAGEEYADIVSIPFEFINY
jgi:hypothetical protein